MKHQISQKKIDKLLKFLNTVIVSRLLNKHTFDFKKAIQNVRYICNALLHHKCCQIAKLCGLFVEYFDSWSNDS